MANTIIMSKYQGLGNDYLILDPKRNRVQLQGKKVALLCQRGLGLSMDVKPGCTVESVKKFYIRFRLEIYRKDELGKPIFTHNLDLSGKEALIQLPIGALGDTIAWFSFVERFQKKHRCKLFCSMEPRLAEIFKAQYPDSHH